MTLADSCPNELNRSHQLLGQQAEQEEESVTQAQTHDRLDMTQNPIDTIDSEHYQEGYRENKAAKS